MKKYLAMVLGLGLISLGLANGQWRSSSSSRSGSTWRSSTSSQSGSKSSYNSSRSYSSTQAASRVSGRIAKIALFLPSTPVDIYIEGVLVKARAASRLDLVTPELPEGVFRYRMMIIDSDSKTIKVPYEINGIEAGKNMQVDLTSAI